jgi:hypothetical protein
MGADRFGQAAAPVGLLAGVRDGHRGNVTAGLIPGKEPALGSGHALPSAQHVQQLGREHHVAIFLALFDSDDHPLAVDVGDFEPDGLREAQPGRVAAHQDGAMLQAGRAAQKLQDFFGA